MIVGKVKSVNMKVLEHVEDNPVTISTLKKPVKILVNLGPVKRNQTVTKDIPKEAVLTGKEVLDN